MAFVETPNIDRKRVDASKPISEQLMSDLKDKSELIEAIVRSKSQVEAVVGGIVNDTTFSTSSVTSGGYGKVKPCHTVVILSGAAQGKRFELISFTATATPDIEINKNPDTEGIATGDSYKIIYGLPVSAKGHGHNGIDSELISSMTLAAQQMAGDVFSADC